MEESPKLAANNKLFTPGRVTRSSQLVPCNSASVSVSIRERRGIRAALFDAALRNRDWGGCYEAITRMWCVNNTNSEFSTRERLGGSTSSLRNTRTQDSRQRETHRETQQGWRNASLSLSVLLFEGEAKRDLPQLFLYNSREKWQLGHSAETRQ